MSEKSLAYSESVVVPVQHHDTHHLSNSPETTGIVDSLLHPLATLIRQVLTRSGRLELNLILIDDEENILQALEAGIEIHSLYYSGGEMFPKALVRKLPRGVTVHEVAKRTCKKLFENDKVSRVFAIARPPAVREINSLLDVPRDIVALEDLTIAGNIGAIVRTCVAFGIGSIVLLNAEPVDIYDRRIIRASRGYIFSLPVLTASTDEFIRFCKENGLSMLAMAAHANNLVHEAAFVSERVVIVFGSEKDGCSQTFMKAANLRVQIPTHSKVESLNVSTAAGIMLYNRAWFNIPQARK